MLGTAKGEPKLYGKNFKRTTMQDTHQQPTVTGRSYSSERKHWLPIVLPPLAILLLLPREHSGKLALAALVLTVLAGLLVANLKLLKVQSGTTLAKVLAGVALAMPILSIGGCIKYTFLNSTLNHDFILFNGSEQPMEIVFNGNTIQLNSRQAVEESTFASKVSITDPATGQATEMAFSEGLHIVAYGAAYELKVIELDYKRVSFSGGGGYGGGAYPNSRLVHSGIFSMKGDFRVYMPGQEVPRTISQPKHSNIRYLALSVKESLFHPDRPDGKEDVMDEAIHRALEKANELK